MSVDAQDLVAPVRFTGNLINNETRVRYVLYLSFILFYFFSIGKKGLDNKLASAVW